MNEQRKDCKIRHPHNGNCVCIGGFCTAVSDEICAGLRSAFEAGKRMEREAIAHLKLTEYELEYARSHTMTLFALWNDLTAIESEVAEAIKSGNDECNPKFVVLTAEQVNNIIVGKSKNQ